jgi:hypothetical protein
MRSPAPRWRARNRAEGIRNTTSHGIPSIKPEVGFAALFVARRYRVGLPVAGAVVALANLGRTFS